MSNKIDSWQLMHFDNMTGSDSQFDAALIFDLISLNLFDLSDEYWDFADWFISEFHYVRYNKRL